MTPEPRYLKATDILVVVVVIAGAVVPPEHRGLARRILAGTMTALLAIAGVVASASMDEAMTLVAGAITMATFSLPLWLRERRAPRHVSPV